MGYLSCTSDFFFFNDALFVPVLRINQEVMWWAVLAASCSLREKRALSPPRPCHLQDGQQENSVLNTTSQQMFALVQSVQTSNWIHCHVLSSAARTLGMTVIKNTLVQTLIKPATNYRGLVQLAAAVSSVTEQLSCLVNDITCLGSEIAVGWWKLNQHVLMFFQQTTGNLARLSVGKIFFQPNRWSTESRSPLCNWVLW